jgi:hypothetical protein
MLAMMPQNSSGCSLATLGPWHDPLDDHRANHQRHDRVRRNPKRQQRNERGLGSGIVGGFRSGNPGDGPVAKLLGVVRHPLLDGVGRERGKHRAPARQDAQDRTDRRSPHHRRDHAAKILARREQAADLGSKDRPILLAFQVAQDLGDAEHPDGQRHEGQAIGKLGDAEGKAGGAGVDVGADKAQDQAQHNHRQRLQD